MIRSGSQKRTLLREGLGCNHLNQIQETNHYSQAHYHRSKQASKRYEEEVATLVLQKKAKLRQNWKRTSRRAGCTHHSQDCGPQMQHVRSYRMRSASSPTTDTEWGTLSAVAGDPSAAVPWGQCCAKCSNTHAARRSLWALNSISGAGNRSPSCGNSPCELTHRNQMSCATIVRSLATWWRTADRRNRKAEVGHWSEGVPHKDSGNSTDTGKVLPDVQAESRKNDHPHQRKKRASQTRVNKPHLGSLSARQGCKQRTLYHLT